MLQQLTDKIHNQKCPSEAYIYARNLNDLPVDEVVKLGNSDLVRKGSRGGGSGGVAMCPPLSLP